MTQTKLNRESLHKLRVEVEQKEYKEGCKERTKEYEDLNEKASNLDSPKMTKIKQEIEARIVKLANEGKSTVEYKIDNLNELEVSHLKIYFKPFGPHIDKVYVNRIENYEIGTTVSEKVTYLWLYI